MRIIDNPNAIEKLSMQAEVNRLAIALIGYLFITSMTKLIIVFISGADINGIVYLLSSLVGLGFIWIMYRKDFGFWDIMEDTREIPPRVFLNAFVVIIGIQPVFQLISQGLDRIFEGFNYIIEYSGFDKNADGSFFVMLNIVIIAPIIEELIFRGLLLRSLAQYGRNFAIITTSVLYGMYNASIIQNGYAFAVGVALAYITLRYSIKWAIVMHCSINMLMMLIAFLNVPSIINYSFLGIFLIWGIVILIIKRKKLKKYFDKGRSKKNAYIYTFTNIYIIAYLVLTIILTFMDIKLTPIY